MSITINKQTLTWQIIDIGSGIKYKTLNPQSPQEFSYGLYNNILQCNKNTLIKNVEKDSEELWDSLFS